MLSAIDDARHFEIAVAQALGNNAIGLFFT
jgi:hypothetical protein